MYRVKRSAASTKNRWICISKPQNWFGSRMDCSNTANCTSDLGVAGFALEVVEKSTTRKPLGNTVRSLNMALTSRAIHTKYDGNRMTKDISRSHGTVAVRRQQAIECISHFRLQFQLTEIRGTNIISHCYARSLTSTASKPQGENQSETRKDISSVEDPFDAPTYNIPEKPVTFTEGASYSVIILAGLGIAAAAGYAVFKELIFEPKEYKIFGMALKRIQNDSQVRVRIGSPITGYGQESRNRAARQRIPNRIWKDEFGVQHVEVNFYIRGPHGAGKVYAAMFKDDASKQWKFTSLIVDILAPSPAQMILESYIPA